MLVSETEYNELYELCESYRRELTEVRAATAREMQSKIQERCIKGGIYPAFVANTIKRVTEEFVEGTK